MPVTLIGKYSSHIPQSLQGSEVLEQGSTQPGIDGKDMTCTPLSLLEKQSPPSSTCIGEPKTPRALTTVAGLCSTHVRGPQTQPAPTPVGGSSSICIGKLQTPSTLTSVAGLCSTRVRGPQTQPTPTHVSGPSSTCIGEPQTPRALTSVAELCSTRVRGLQTQPAPTHVDTSNPIGVSLVT